MLFQMRRVSAAAGSSSYLHPHVSPEPPALRLRRLHGLVVMARRTTLTMPPLSVSIGLGMKPIDLGVKISTNCVNSTSNQTEELLQTNEDVLQQKRSAKIHDFCFGIPFGGLLFCMGLLGYFFSRSTVSLVLGVAPGLATLFLGTLSLMFWRSRRSSTLFILGQAATSALLAWKYSQAYLLTNKILPWGFYTSLSTMMVCFYAYVLIAGGNPPPKKLAVTSSSS